MALVDLWQRARGQLEGKGFQQIIAFAGDGKLRDGGTASEELRSFLSLVPTEYRRRYSAECLAKSFPDSGFALQEVVNQIGRRLGFSVVDGRYRGVKGGVDALERLMLLKEDLEDPTIIRRIHDILVPREFTKLDEIVDLVFSATEDVRESEMAETEAEPAGKKGEPVSFHAACMDRIAAELGEDFLRHSRASFVTPDRNTAVLCAVSREYSGARHEGYWFAFHPHQKEFLESAGKSYVGFGCGSPDQLILFPYADFSEWLVDFNRTELENRFYWHVRINRKDGRFFLLLKAGRDNLDITKYLLGEKAS